MLWFQIVFPEHLRLRLLCPAARRQRYPRQDNRTRSQEGTRQVHHRLHPGHSLFRMGHVRLVRTFYDRSLAIYDM